MTLCITLMLAVAGIGSSAEEYSFEIPQIHTREDLETALLYAQCYHAHTPEEAVYLFLRACEERNLIYRMAVMPESEIPRYGEFAGKWLFENREALVWEDLNEGMEEEYPSYLPEVTGAVRQYAIYNLQCDEETGSATVCVDLYKRSDRADFAEWELELTRENGWKVWLARETRHPAGEYRPEALLCGSGRLGDFLVEVSCWNEGYFDQLGMGNQYPGLSWLHEQSVEEKFPTALSMEYKCQSVHVTYLGEESLEGHAAKVVVADSEGNFDPEVVEADTAEELRNARAEAAGAPALGAESISGSSGCSSDGRGYALFDGGEWMDGTPRLIVSGGTGSSEPDQGWKRDEPVRVRVRIYIDGALAEEGEVWSEGH